MSLVTPANASEYRRLALEVFRQASADFTGVGDRPGYKRKPQLPLTRAYKLRQLAVLDMRIKAGIFLLRSQNAAMWAKWFSCDIATLRDWMVRTYPEWPAQLEDLEGKAEKLRAHLQKTKVDKRFKAA